MAYRNRRPFFSGCGGGGYIDSPPASSYILELMGVTQKENESIDNTTMGRSLNDHQVSLLVGRLIALHFVSWPK
jgi:hypothetical protein